MACRRATLVLDEHDRPSCEKPSQTTLAWQRTMWAYTKFAKVVSGFHWYGKSTCWIDEILTEKARQWEEEGGLARGEEEHRKMGRRRVDLDGNQLMDIGNEVADILLGSGSEDERDSDEIKGIKV
jgi:hypothetical protein